MSKSLIFISTIAENYIKCVLKPLKYRNDIFCFLLQHDFSLNKLINNNIHTFHDCTKNGLFLLYEECGLRFQKKNVEQRLFA